MGHLVGTGQKEVGYGAGYAAVKAHYEQLPHEMCMSSLYSVSIYLFDQGHFELAERLLNIVKELSRYKYKSYILLQGISRKVKHQRLDVELDLVNLENESYKLQAMVQYFHHQKVQSFDEQLNELNHVVCTYMEKSGLDDPFYEIFRDEMLALIDEECLKHPEKRVTLIRRKYHLLRKFRQIVE